MAVLPFTIRVDDEGTGVVEKFTGNVEDSAKKAKRSAGRMTKAFAGVRKGIGRVSGAVFSLRGLLVGLGATAVVRSVLRAAFAQEEAVTRVNAALRASGQFSEEASQALQDFASQMQATTIFGDEVILNQVALAQAFGFTTENVQEAVAAAVELSAAAGIQLEEAVRRLGRSISGSVEDIAKFAPEIRNLTKEQLAAGDAARVLGNALRGQAAAQAETARGRFIQLGNALGDVVERIGQSITESTKFSDALKDLAAGINAANSAGGDDKGRLGDVLARFVPKAETASLASEIFNKTLEGAATTFELVSVGVNKASVEIQKLGLRNEIAEQAALGNIEAVRILVDQAKFLDLTHKETTQEFRRNARALVGLTTEQDNATVTMGGLIQRAKSLNEALDADIKALQGASEATKSINDQIAEINNLTPEAARAFNAFALQIEDRVDALPDFFAEKRDELQRVISDPPGFIPIKAGVDQAAAELDRLEQRFAQVPTAIQTPLQQSSTALTNFFNVIRSETGQLFAQQVSESQAAVESITTTQAQLTEVFRAAEFQRSQIRGEGEEAERQRAAADVRINAAKNQVILQGAFALGAALLSFADKGGRKAFEFAKGLAIAEAIVSGIQATQAALASPPGPPFTIPLAAAIAVQTAANVRRIAATEFMGGAAAGAVGGAAPGGAAAAPAPGAPAPAVEAAPVTAGPQITISVSGFIGDEAQLASALGEIISEAEGDDVEFQLS